MPILEYVRRTLITKPLFGYFRTLVPEMSDTELAVIETGDVWFDRELFSGAPNFLMLKKLPISPLTDDEQQFIDGPVEELCRTVDEWHITVTTKDLPKSVWEFLREKKFFAILIPKEYGGLGFSKNAFSVIIKKLISRVSTVASTVLIPNSLGPQGLLIKYGTPEQKEYYLSRLASGDEIPAFAMTSPFAGCDVASIPDIGHVEYGMYKGKKVLGIRVTWEKRYITLAPIATILGLAFRTFRDGKEIGISCALVPTDHPGVNIGRRHWPARQNFMNGPTWGTDVFIPMEMIIGGEAMIGKGWPMFIQQLYTGRALSIPALATAATQYTARYVGAYARLREQFRRPIGHFEGVQSKLAEIAAESYTLECARKVTLGLMDSGTTPAVISALLKYQSTERCRTAVNDGMDILAGRGVMEGPRNFLFDIYQMLPIIITVEGANILTRSFITFGHGIMRCHKFLLTEYRAIARNDIQAFDSAFAGHVLHILSLFIRAPLRALLAPFLSKSAYEHQISLASARFALLTEVVLLFYGGGLKKRERVSGNMADVLSEMYLTSTVLNFYNKDEKDNALLTSWIAKRSLYNIEHCMTDVLANLPNQWAAYFVKSLLFPFGLRARLPTMAEDKELARMLQSDNKTRDMITEGIFVTEAVEDKTGCLESGLKIVTSGGTLTAEHLRAVIDVDHFHKKEFAEL